MGILKGKANALERIEKSKLAFVGRLSDVEKGPSSHTMPPKDHFILKFHRDSIQNLKGRVYENMKQYSYEQRGYSILAKRFVFFQCLLVFLGETIPIFIDNKETEDPEDCLNPTKPEVPTVGHQYVVCVYDDLRIIDCLIEIQSDEIDELIKMANARRNSVI